MAIALARFPGSDAAHRVGSLFLNPGGPGGSGVNLVRGAGEALDRFLGGRFDIVGFDPRGVGASTAVRCFNGPEEQALFYSNEPPFPVGRAQQRRYIVKTGVLTDLCGARNGALLRHVSTAAAARDLDRLRAAVGDRQLTYWGFSYGTILGATYANLFPGRVRALVLDGVSDPVAYTSSLVAWTRGSLRDTEAVRRGFARTCAAAGPRLCALAGRGDVARRMDAVLTRLRRRPIPAPTAPVPGVLDYQTAAVILFSTLYRTEAWPQLAEGFASAERGDGSALLRVPPPAPPGYDNTNEAQKAILCTDSPAPRDPSRWPAFVRGLSRISPTGAGLFGWFVDLACATWPAQAAQRYTGPWGRRLAHPVVLVGVTADPVTPLASARKLARLMGANAVLVTHVGYGHTSLGQLSSCTLATIGAYLGSAVPPARGTICRANAPPFSPTATSRLRLPYLGPPAAAGPRGAEGTLTGSAP